MLNLMKVNLKNMRQKVTQNMKEFGLHLKMIIKIRNKSQNCDHVEFLQNIKHLNLTLLISAIMRAKFHLNR